MSKKNILIIGFGIDKNRYEAVSINTIKHKDILEKLGHKVLVYNIAYKNKYFDTGFNFGSSIRKRHSILKNLELFIKKNKITHILDIFVLPLSSQIFVLPLKKLFPDIVFIKELHNDSGFSLKFHSETLIRLIANTELSLSIVLNKFDKVFTNNLFLSKKRQVDYVPTTIAIYPNPKTKFNKKIISICYLGHPLKKKGVFEFEKLFHILPEKYKSRVVFNFAFSSVGPRERVIEEFSILAKEKNIKIKFFGEVNPDKFFRKNDIYILPIHDHFGAVSTPNTILEAMEAGCLVIVHKIKSLEGIFNNKEVVYLPYYGAEHILNSIKKVFKNIPAEEKRIKRARKKIEKTYGANNIINLINKIYE